MLFRSQQRLLVKCLSALNDAKQETDSLQSTQHPYLDVTLQKQGPQVYHLFIIQQDQAAKTFLSGESRSNHLTDAKFVTQTFPQILSDFKQDLTILNILLVTDHEQYILFDSLSDDHIFSVKRDPTNAGDSDREYGALKQTGHPETYLSPEAKPSKRKSMLGRNACSVPWMVGSRKAGGMYSTVAAVRHQQVDFKSADPYIIKMQRAGVQADNELVTLMQLQSSGIVPCVYDAFECKGYMYIVMEKLDGTLENYFEAHKKDVSNQQFRTSLQHVLVDVITHLNQAGVLHGDLNPVNIMFEGNIKNEPKKLKWFIIDFNTSQSWHDVNDRSKTTDLAMVKHLLNRFDYIATH